MNNESDFTEVAEVPRNASALPESGLMQTRTPYSTAVQVIRPRSLALVENRCLEEAAIAGDDFYYSWSQGGQVTEGLTIGAALAIARNMGNNAVDVEVRETPGAYYFTGAYIDLETGFNVRRTFRQNKQSPRSKSGKEIYSGERGQDIIFQIGQSKAIRNVVLNAVPNWLGRKVFEKAKENVAAKIEKMGKVKASEMLTSKMSALGIPLDRVVAVYGKPETWDVEKIVRITGAVRAIEDGRERLDDVFPGAPAEPLTNTLADAAKAAIANQAKRAAPAAVQEAAIEAEAFGEKETRKLLAFINGAANQATLEVAIKEVLKRKDAGEITDAQAEKLHEACSARQDEVVPKKKGIPTE